jgi:hypothetical protein
MVNIKFLVLFFFFSCTVKKVPLSVYPEKQVEIDNINFFGKITYTQPSKKQKYGVLFCIDTTSNAMYLRYKWLKNIFFKIENIADSSFLLTSQKNNGDLILDSILFTKNRCIYKRMYQYAGPNHIPIAQDSNIMQSLGINNIVVEIYDFDKYALYRYTSKRLEYASEDEFYRNFCNIYSIKFDSTKNYLFIRDTIRNFKNEDALQLYKGYFFKNRFPY